MAIDSETVDASIRRRKIGTLSNHSSASDLLNNNNEKLVDCINKECIDVVNEFDADNTTLNPSTTEHLKETTKHLSHDDALNKLKEVGAKTPILPSQIGTDFNFKRQVVWKNAIGFLVLHICALIGFGLSLFGFARVYTLLYSMYSHTPDEEKAKQKPFLDLM